MTGRGIDQIMPRPCAPMLHEPYIRSALGYVELAERASGEIPRAVPFDYIWGEALDEIDRREPDFRIVNLETSITADGKPEAKGINYRMHPDNVGCITAAEIDCCVLANNHVADWGLDSLDDTLLALQRAGIAVAGAGRDAYAATQPAALEQVAGRRLLVFAFACPSCGIPAHWAADEGRAGVNFLADFGEEAVASLARNVSEFRQPGDVVLASVHWGSNWGYDVPIEHRSFAHDLIDGAQADIVHGHSSHHALAIEVYAGRPILYGCGDFINDYEGIRGYEEFRPDLAVAYFLDIDDRDNRLLGLELVPFRLQKFQLVRAFARDAMWLEETLDRECRRFGHEIRLTEDGTLALSW
jgi:poly-gamma-glutamate synthesis protein (capsule biosynthesis protein)